MKTISLSLAVFFTLACVGVQAQEQAKVKVELIYKLDQAKQGNPLPDLIKALKSKAKDVPQEDIDWVLNSVRLDVARRQKVLYTNDGGETRLPDDTRQIITSKNLKYMIVYTDNQKEWEQEKLGHQLKQEMLRYGGMKNDYLWQMEKATDDKMKKIFADSAKYYEYKYNEAANKLKDVSEIVKIIKRCIFMRNEDGKLLWDRNDVQRPSYISNDGKVIVAAQGVGEFEHIYTTVYFYDERGNEKKKISGHLGFHGCFELSGDGELFCAITRKDAPDSFHVSLSAYDKNGNQLWNTIVEGDWPPSYHAIDISDDHKYVAISVDRKPGGAFTYLINDYGKVIKSFEFRTPIPVISGNGKYLVCPEVNDNIYLIRTDDGEILWKRPVDNLMNSCFITNDGEYIYANLAGTPQALLLDKDGNILAELETHGAISPMGKILKNAKGIYMNGGKNGK